MTNSEAQRALDVWFDQQRRFFPWREEYSPYRVLVSEIMLQQTQADRVVPFFLRWMDQFPTIHALASASEEAVIKAWEGLGYYSRARALYRLSKIVVSSYGGDLPVEEESLRALPGIGQYTAGAIRSFAFHKRAAAVDANVRRVVYRFAGENVDPHHFVLSFLPEERPWTTMEALIELGALICTRVPACPLCPLRDGCRAYACGKQEERPRRALAARTKLWRDVAVIRSKGHVLVLAIKGRRVMSGLCEFLSFEGSAEGRSPELFAADLSADLSLMLSPIAPLRPVSHTFTRYHATLYPVLMESDEMFTWPDGLWVPLQDLVSLPFSAGHRRIANQILA